MTSSNKKRPTLGIALGGGGAKGFAHIGVLKVLERAGVTFDIVTGTSVGALVGAVYASGTLSALEEAAKTIKLTEIPLLLSPTWSKSGFFSGKNALEMLSEFVTVETIEQLPRKFATVSSDIISGEQVVYSSGDIHRAVRASIAIPMLFTPVKDNSRLLVDGGLVNPVPVSIARELGADIVIAVDLFGPDDAPVAEKKERENTLWPAGISSAVTYFSTLSSKVFLGNRNIEADENKQKSKNIIEILERTLAISQRMLTTAQLQQNPPDMLIHPQVAKVSLLDFHRGEPVIALGEQAAEVALAEILDVLG